MRVFVPGSETGQSGTLYEGDYEFGGSRITVDAMLNALRAKNVFTYSYDGEYITIDGLGVVENAEMRYVRGWVVKVNGELCLQRGKKLRPGDEVILEIDDDRRELKVDADH